MAVTVAPSAQLRVVFPSNGATVPEATITVVGTAPPGSRVVRDISFAPDQTATAAADGAWTMAVELAEGENQLTFRVGDDRSTSSTVTVVRSAAVAVLTATPAVTAPPAPVVTPTTAATPLPTAPPRPTPTPAPTPAPTPEAATFYDGTNEVGVDIEPGTYRLRSSADFCYWARLRGTSGELKDIIANDNVNGYAVVTIKRTDKAFESDRCGEWSADLSAVVDPGDPIPEGTLIVGIDIQPGTYRRAAGDGCYWAGLRGFSGEIGDIIANGNTDGAALVTIRSSDKGFSSARCGDWTRRT